MKSTNNRYYLDYNATSPLADSVKEYLARGDFPLGNPSSVHHDGKQARRLINETSEYLFDLFGLGQNHQLVFHSGATEGLNSLLKGYGLCAFSHKKSAKFAFNSVDHSCIVNQQADLELLGHKVFEVPVDRNGTSDLLAAQNFFGSDPNLPLLYCHTHVNNETGVVRSLKHAVKFKMSSGCRVCVDSVQTVGKIDRWWELEEDLDAYTFSGHKFGAIKGIGFSFIRSDFPIIPLIKGGGQQHGLRSGTENVMGIHSLKLALEELKAEAKPKELESLKLEFEKNLQSLLGAAGEIVASGAPERNINTIYFIIYGKKADTLLTALDLAGIDVSTGSACSSGATIPSRVLQKMGYSEADAKSAIRLSFGPCSTEDEMQHVWQKTSQVLRRFL